MSRALELIWKLDEKKKGKGPVLTVSQMMEAVNNRGTPPTVAIIKTTPLVGNKTLSVKAEAMGTKLYPLTATFYNVDFSLEKDPSHPLTVRPEVGTVAYMEQISQGEHPVQVRCQCPDFRHTYAHWDRQERSLSGRAFPKYERKTTHLPERNPRHQPGVCKHIVGLFERLIRDRVLR